MPLGQPPLLLAAIQTVRRWILAGAPNWETQKQMFESLEKHVNSLAAFARPLLTISRPRISTISTQRLSASPLETGQQPFMGTRGHQTQAH